MDCVTPSNPTPIPPGETRTIYDAITKTHGGHLGEAQESTPSARPKYTGRRQQAPTDILWLQAQSAQSDRELQSIARQYNTRRYSQHQQDTEAKEWWESAPLSSDRNKVK